MKKIIALSLVLATVGFTATAQNERAERADTYKKEHVDRKQKHFDELGLNESQKTQMKALNAEFKQKREALRTSGLSQEQMQAQRKALNDERKSKLKAILTADQWNKMEEMKKERKMHKGKMHEGKMHKKRDGMNKGSKGSFKKMQNQ